MTDPTPQNPREGLPPVRMALRVIGRHGHRGGPQGVALRGTRLGDAKAALTEWAIRRTSQASDRA